MPASHSFNLAPALQQSLLQLARQSIEHGLQTTAPLKPDMAQYPAPLQQDAASFVTLNLEGRLRGCIGSLVAYQAMVLDIAEHAYAAAFNDPRFPALTAAEYRLISVHISLLSPPVALPKQLNQAQLEQLLTPSIDGLILRQGYRRAVFLPQVWQQLPSAEQFITRLKLKGGWQADSPIEQMQAYRFSVDEFGCEPTA